jgi:hypothetical protein
LWLDKKGEIQTKTWENCKAINPTRGAKFVMISRERQVTFDGRSLLECAGHVSLNSGRSQRCPSNGGFRRTGDVSP